MRVGSRVLLLLIAVLLSTPVALGARTEEAWRIEVGANEASVQYRSLLTGSDAQQMRSRIDKEYGDNDGQVEAGELADFEEDNSESFDQERPDCFDNFELVRLDGKPPTHISRAGVAVENAHGPVGSTAPIVEIDFIDLAYADPEGASTSATVRFGEGESFGMAVACYFFDGWNWNWGRTPPPGCCPAFSEWEEPSAAQEQSAETEDYGTLELFPRPGATLSRSSIRPIEFQQYWDGRGLVAESSAARAAMGQSTLTVAVRGGASTWGGTVRDVGAVIGYGTLGIGLAGLGLALSTESGRFHLWKWLVLVPGFTRIEKDEVLEHQKREELYRFIRENPGQSFSDLRRELELTNGTLVHHLRILETQEFVKPVRDGFRTRFYIRGPKIVPSSYLTRVQQQILDAISGNPGVTQKQLSQILGLPRESVSYHTKQLATKGRLHVRQEGKWRHYYPPATGPGPSAAATPTP